MYTYNFTVSFLEHHQFSINAIFVFYSHWLFTLDPPTWSQFATKNTSPLEVMDRPSLSRWKAGCGWGQMLQGPDGLRFFLVRFELRFSEIRSNFLGSHGLISQIISLNQPFLLEKQGDNHGESVKSYKKNGLQNKQPSWLAKIARPSYPS